MLSINAGNFMKIMIFCPLVLGLPWHPQEASSKGGTDVETEVSRSSTLSAEESQATMQMLIAFAVMSAQVSSLIKKVWELISTL